MPEPDWLAFAEKMVADTLKHMGQITPDKLSAVWDAPIVGLDGAARGLGLTRRPGETDDDFRTRVLGYSDPNRGYCGMIDLGNEVREPYGTWEWRVVWNLGDMDGQPGVPHGVKPEEPWRGY